MRRVMRASLLALGASAVFAACGGRADEVPSVAVSQPVPTASAAAAGETVPHGDHNPHHGGIVLMNGDLHFEVVLGRNGSHRVFFTDAVRKDLPAATASAVTVTVERKGQAAEAIALQIDDSGESWVGRGRPVDDPAATARVAYTASGMPYFIDVPFPR
jgi:hypothetical protein